MLSEKEVFIS